MVALPLYAQVQAKFTQHIGDGVWKPGDLLPTEMELAAEYGVSQGTVRKALIALEAETLIVRRQGVGTYVARHERDTALFHFFRIVGPDGARLTPRSRVLHQKIIAATSAQAEQLQINRGARIHAIERIRTLRDIPAIHEEIFTPVALVPSLSLPKGSEMDEEMYVIYQENCGILIARAAEKLRAISANRKIARALGLDEGTPLLEVVRVAYDVNARPVELRISRCDTRGYRYAADVF